MDLKSFYKKIDVDGIKNKLPPLPQLKIPKIKSRKIFKSSREDLAQQQSPSKAVMPGVAPITPQSLPGSSPFIDRTPTRISTVSSLMNINYGFKDKNTSGLSTYRTANNFEEENCPDEFDTRETASASSVTRFGDRCKKTYKDFSDFKIKTIFAKKTVVKKTEIEVDVYARQYERELHLEERELEIELEEEGYDFQFKEARRCLSRSSNSISPPDSLASGVPSPIRSELKHLQRNNTPPMLAKRRNALAEGEAVQYKIKRSISEESADIKPKRSNKSSLWGKNERSISADSDDNQLTDNQAEVSRMARFKKSMVDGFSEGMRGKNMPSESGDEQPQPGISRLGRLKKSMKDGFAEGMRGRHTATESEDEQPSAGTSRMAKFKKSAMESFGGRQISEEPSETDQPSGGVSRMARMKKSMQEGISEGIRGRIIAPPESENDTDQASTNVSRMTRPKKSMKEGIPEGKRGKNIPPDESGEDYEQPSRIARFKKSMQEGISEGIRGKSIPPAESGDDTDQPSASVSRMARFKKSMKQGISEGKRGKSIPPAESGDDTDQPPATASVSRMARFKKSMKEGMPEGMSRKKNIADSSARKASMDSGDDHEQPPAGESRLARFKKSMKEGMSHELGAYSDTNWNLKGIRNRFASEESGLDQKSKKNPQSQESLDEPSDTEKKSWKLSNIHLRRSEPKEKSTEPAVSSPEGKFSSIKMSINRLKNRKPDRQTSEESEAEPNDENNKSNVSNQLKAGIRRLKLRDRSQTFDEEEEPKTPKESTTSRFRDLKKSIKLKRASQPPSEDDLATDTQPPLPPLPPGRSLTLIRKLNNIRSRKVVSEDEDTAGDPSSTTDEQKLKTTNLEKFEQARTKALRKVNAQVQKMKNLQGKSKDSPDKPAPTEASQTTYKTDTEDLSEDDSAHEVSKPPAAPRTAKKSIPVNTISGRKVVTADDDATSEPPPGSDERKPKSTNLEKFEQARTKALRKVNAQVQKMKNLQGKSKDSPDKPSAIEPTQKTYKTDTEDLSEDDSPPEVPKPPAAIWTTNKMISQSLDSDDDGVDLPRVLIHQDNSDQYESTLIIAVTRPAPSIPSPIIKEIIPKVKYPAPKSEWIPNKNAVSNFLEMTPSPPSQSPNHLDVSRGHIRKRSVDSNDSDSWIPENFRNKSASSSTSGGLNKISGNSEPWKVHSVFSDERLYKTKSIDIFANRDGAGAFTDFDDEMKNVPVRRIMAASADSLNKSFDESSEDDDDYDNASKITRLKHQSPVVNTRASIESINNRSVDSNKAYRGSPVPTTKAQIGNSQESLDANYDENDEISSDEDNDDDMPTMAPSPPPSFSPPPPPLPSRKPPRMLPERNDSMVRLAHPLVKQGSLRRHFSEEIEPSDLGKVNKLITRFEKNPSIENLPRILLIPSDDELASFELEEKKAAKTNDNGAKKRVIPSNESIEKEEKKKATKSKENNNKKQQTRNVSSDEEGNFKIEEKKATRSSGKRRPAPVPVPVPNINTSNNNNNNNNLNNNNEMKSKTKPEKTPSPDLHENLDNISIQSPNSEYGSPIGSVCFSERTSSEYGSPIGVAFPVQLRANRRLSNRSSLRDDDTFYSFESDEENNFYSLGDSSDMRYTIEI